MQTVKLAARICVVCTLLFAGSSCPTGTQSYGFLMADGIARTYVLHVPKSYDGATPVPLLVALHPFGCDAQLMQMLTGFNQISEREGFIVVYPDGRDRMWNSNPSDPFELISEPLDDVKFISALLDRLLEDYAIDPARVYVTGGSQGGLMAQRAAGEMPERFAAAATVMTTLPRKWPEHVHPKSPLPFLVIHGKEDPFLPWSGGEVYEGPSRTIEYLGAEESARFWAETNSCNSDTPLKELLPDIDPNDRARVFRVTFNGGAGDVLLYGVRGGGHTWPGSRVDLPDVLMGNTTYDINASEEIWKFFSQHKRLN